MQCTSYNTTFFFDFLVQCIINAKYPNSIYYVILFLLLNGNLKFCTNLAALMSKENLFYKTLEKKSNKNTLTIKPYLKPINSNLFYIKKNEKYNYVHHRLTNLKQSFLELLDIKNFEPLNHLSTTSFYIFGIITKINDQALTKENAYISNNTDESNNLLLKLNFTHVGKISIYPGQIVALHGKNVCNEFIIENFYPIPVVDTNYITKEVLEEYSDFYINKTLEIGIINGPFLNDMEIIERTLDKQYDLLVLLGPFLSVYNENIDCLNYFENVSKLLESWLKKSMHSRILIVPSTNEYKMLNIYPQQKNAFCKNDRIIFMPNPSMFYINEFLFSICNFDNLKDLASNEYSENRDTSRNDECSEMLFSKDRIFRLSNHMIYQKSFLSIFPNSECVDYKLPESFDMDIIPDFYITASKLKEFDVQVGPSRVINIGCQSKIENKYMTVLSIKGSDIVKDENTVENRFSISRHKL